MNETKKLSGPAKDRFFKRFFTEAGGLDEPTADRLTECSKQVFSSVRVRKNAEALNADSTATATKPAPAPKKQAAEARDTSRKQHEPTSRSPKTKAPDPVAVEPAKPDISLAEQLQASPPETTEDADPFVFGLVPVYKREGAEGLLVKLAEIRSVAHLRAMAKAQQIVLARELRTGDIDVVTLRAAILEAVEKRVADRRAV